MKALAGVAIGAGLAATSFGGAWWISEQTRQRQAFILTYTKPGGMMPGSSELLAGDPAHFTVPATRYAAFIASRCKLSRWTMSNNADSSDVPEQAVLKVPADNLNDRQFGCLISFVKRDYVTLTRTIY